ncbi:3799_t:CDS:1, partial [Racocetra persica]
NKNRLENEVLPFKQSCIFYATSGQVIQRSAKTGVKQKRLSLDIYIIEIKSYNKDRKEI